MVGGMGHTGGLTNPRLWCQAGNSNTGGPPLPRKRAPLTKKGKCGQESNLNLEIAASRHFSGSSQVKFFSLVWLAHSQHFSKHSYRKNYCSQQFRRVSNCFK